MKSFVFFGGKFTFIFSHISPCLNRTRFYTLLTTSQTLFPLTKSLPSLQKSPHNFAVFWLFKLEPSSLTRYLPRNLAFLSRPLPCSDFNEFSSHFFPAHLGPLPTRPFTKSPICFFAGRTITITLHPCFRGVLAVQKRYLTHL